MPTRADPGCGAAGGPWRRAAASSGAAFLSCAKLVGDYRVLGCIAFGMFLCCLLGAFTGHRPADAVEHGMPVAARAAGSPGEPIATANGVGTLAPCTKGRIENAPGDFLADLQWAFESGSSTQLVRLQDYDEERLFESWREVLAPDYSISGTLLRKVATAPDGVSSYEIVDPSAGISGLVSVQRIAGRWRVVGARRSREQAWSGPDPELFEHLEMMRKHRMAEPARPSGRTAGPIEDEGGILSPAETETHD